MFLFFFISSINGRNSTHLSCPQRIGFVGQGLTTVGKCYHCNPPDRSCWPWHPPPPSHSELWGTDLGPLWRYETELEVVTMTRIDSDHHLHLKVVPSHHHLHYCLHYTTPNWTPAFDSVFYGGNYGRFYSPRACSSLPHGGTLIGSMA